MLMLPQAVLGQMADHLTACLPEEGCGLLGGQGQTAVQCVAVENALHSPVRFRMQAMEQFSAMMRFDAAGLELLAIFHSHPRGPGNPSATDVAEFYYPGVLVLICAPYGLGAARRGVLRVGNWQITGYQIEPEGVLAVKLEILGHDPPVRSKDPQFLPEA